VRRLEMAVVVEHVEIVAALLERVGVARDAATCKFEALWANWHKPLCYIARVIKA
jgi:hypothetical protein